MPFVKKIKSDAYFSRFQVKYRRRREGKTDCVSCSFRMLRPIHVHLYLRLCAQAVGDPGQEQVVRGKAGDHGG